MRTVINESGEAKSFETDQQFLEYARQVYRENEIGSPFGDSIIHFMPKNISNALEYIEEYCGDLELIEN